MIKYIVFGDGLDVNVIAMNGILSAAYDSFIRSD